MTTPQFPAPGCIVEYMEDNAPQIAFVQELANGRARLLLPSRKEVKLAQNRLLPWAGPMYSPDLGREECVKLLEKHKTAREQKAREIDALELWELSTGEIDQAEAGFFAELVESAPDEDTLAAYGRSLLECKTHFRFQPPYFTVFSREITEKRLAEQKAKAEREALISGGANFLRGLWERVSKKSAAPIGKLPDPGLADRLEKLLFSRVINPDATEDENLWQMLVKSLPDVPHLPLQLLMAWGKLPPHYNFWLARADYDEGDDWWEEYREEVDALARSALESAPECDLPFISIDSATTRDIDDAFHIARQGTGWRLTLALAAPALHWPFGGALDKKVARRATSLYLPEGTLHMLPETLGTDIFSLKATEPRPALCMTMDIDQDGKLLAFTPFVANVRLAANLDYSSVQAFLEKGEITERTAPFTEMLTLADEMAKTRENCRIARGAVVMRTSEQIITLSGSGDDVRVRITPEAPDIDSRRLVAEMMIVASEAFAQWSVENNLPVIFRTQHVTIPREYAGVWSRPDDLTRIVKALTHSILETEPRPHAAIGAECYAPVTSPLRRYTDLINEAQAIHFLHAGEPKWSKESLTALLDSFSPDLDNASQVQRYRPRYWRLLYVRQQGDKKWWPAIITEENENFVTVQIPDSGILVRGRRNLFDERAGAGQRFLTRLGKVNPLYNEIQILEVMRDEQAGA